MLFSEENKLWLKCKHKDLALNVTCDYPWSYGRFSMYRYKIVDTVKDKIVKFIFKSSFAK